MKQYEAASVTTVMHVPGEKLPCLTLWRQGKDNVTRIVYHFSESAGHFCDIYTKDNNVLRCTNIDTVVIKTDKKGNMITAKEEL